jgi:tRNA threonylcarbamoyladenosine biosynthesis protein TsaE
VVTSQKTEVHELKSLSEMKAFASKLAERAGHRRLILLDGPMGAGKTQFTRDFVEALGSSEACSPSFAIHNRYETERASVEHMDLYRLESADDLESTGFWDFFLEREGIVIVEWSHRLRDMGLQASWPRTWPRWEIELSISASGQGAASETRVARLTEIGPG